MSLPFWIIGEPLTTVVNRGQHFFNFWNLEGNKPKIEGDNEGNEGNHDGNEANYEVNRDTNEVNVRWIIDANKN